MFASDELAAGVGGVVSVGVGVVIFIIKLVTRIREQSTNDSSGVRGGLDIEARLSALESRQKVLIEVVSSIYQEAKFLAEIGLHLSETVGLDKGVKDMTQKSIDASLQRISRIRLNNLDFFQ